MNRPVLSGDRGEMHCLVTRYGILDEVGEDRVPLLSSWNPDWPAAPLSCLRP